jgi:hypothetical protein
MLVFLLAGCGSRSERATVSGKVTHKGQTLNSGTVQFHGPGGKGGSCSISENGSYVATDVPVGDNVVTVRVVASLVGPGTKPPPGTPTTLPGGGPSVSIPPQFGDNTKSTLKYTIKPGSQTINIDIP